MQFLEKPIRLDKQIWDKGVVPLVSISCITYNHEKYIKDAIEGFLMQETTFPVEINIHEDASTDNTANIVREYEKKYPNVLFNVIYQTENQYSKKDGSIRRIQHSRARGKYYAICEGDDYWKDQFKLQKQINLLEKHGDSCVLSFHPVTLKVHNELNINGIIGYLGNQKKVINPFQIISNYIPTASAVIRSNIFQNYPELSKRAPFGDAFLWGVAASKGHAIYLPESMAVRRKHNQGVYNSLSAKSQLENSIETRELMLNSKELSEVHIYIKAYLLALYQKYFWAQRGSSHKYQIFKKTSSFIFNSPSTIFWYFKIPLHKQTRRIKRYFKKIGNIFAIYNI